jgi:hypothetical protein
MTTYIDCTTTWNNLTGSITYSFMLVDLSLTPESYEPCVRSVVVADLRTKLTDVLDRVATTESNNQDGCIEFIDCDHGSKVVTTVDKHPRYTWDRRLCLLISTFINIVVRLVPTTDLLVCKATTSRG